MTALEEIHKLLFNYSRKLRDLNDDFRVIVEKVNELKDKDKSRINGGKE